MEKKPFALFLVTFVFNGYALLSVGNYRIGDKQRNEEQEEFKSAGEEKMRSNEIGK